MTNSNKLYYSFMFALIGLLSYAITMQAQEINTDGGVDTSTIIPFEVLKLGNEYIYKFVDNQTVCYYTDSKAISCL